MYMQSIYDLSLNTCHSITLSPSTVVALLQEIRIAMINRRRIWVAPEFIIDDGLATCKYNRRSVCEMKNRNVGYGLVLIENCGQSIDDQTVICSPV